MNEASKTTKGVVKAKPYLTGKPLDSSCLGSALRFFLYYLLIAVAFLFLGVMLSFDNFVVNLVVNAALLLAMLTVMFQSGATAGTGAVNAGEMAYQRKESGRMLNPGEVDACYHPMKGLLTALLGSLPVLIAATVLACLAQRQMTSIGALPTWVSSMQSNVDNGIALAVYNQQSTDVGMNILRVVVRCCILPFLNIVGTSNKDAVLTLEHLSPLLCCLPMLAYGLGYPQGVKIRAQVQADIAAGKRKAKKKAKKEQRQREQRSSSQQLN